MLACAAILAIVMVFVIQSAERTASAVHPDPRWPVALSTRPGSYLGVYANGAPNSYAGATAFTAVTGVRPRIVPYYSGWLEPFQVGFATTVAEHGAVPLVQIDPTRVSLAAIESGYYDSYLSSYARAVLSYHRPVILSFGHEMNGNWYTWGYQRSSSREFVAAWRHIVTLFRARGAQNVTWLWTINVEGSQDGPISEFWPGRRYVNWVGIDGYYYTATYQFASLFGPTIAAVREMTRAPILIAETGVSPAAGQPAKIPDLFNGIRTYGLLGLIWFDVSHIEDWQLSNSAAIGAFRKAAKAFARSAS